ncbi:type II toxin-antitoxin system RelE family toxin [Ursidibacter arcticus]
MANSIKWQPKALKQLFKIDVRYIPKIKQAVNSLVDFPNVLLDIKKLQGQESKYRLRIGGYRVVFEWIDGEPKIIEIQAIKKRDEQTYH